MRRSFRSVLLPLLTVSAIVATLASAPSVHAQDHAHPPGMTHDPRQPAPAPAPAPPSGAPSGTPSGAPVEPGQSAFAAVAEVVRILEADTGTDWSKVRLDALRDHLRDMDDVVLRTTERAVPVAGGARFEVRGTGRTVAAVRRMARAHGRMLSPERDYDVLVRDLPDGASVTVTARTPDDARATARIRALGFVGLLTTGGHHGPHHLAIARGAGAHAHGH